jgi:hypothetical protein
LAPAEGQEGRWPTKENIGPGTTPWTQSQISASGALHGVRQAASNCKRIRFTALLHHVDVNLLRASYDALQRVAAPGVDGVTWASYQTDREARQYCG